MFSDMRAAAADQANVKQGMPPAAAMRMSLGGADNDQAAGEWVVTKIITDAINPQYGERVRPPVSVLWQMLKDPIAEKHLPFPPTAPKTAMRNDGRKPMTPAAPPKDVQAR
jgi:hypothetical protein